MGNLLPINDASGAVLTATAQTPVKFGSVPVFDFITGEFEVGPDGKCRYGDKIESYEVWCCKALLDKRYVYEIYSSGYGSEIDELFQKAYPKELLESEVKRMTVEALKFDSRTKRVDNFSFWYEDDTSALYFSCDVYTVRGDKYKLKYNMDGEVVMSADGS